MAQASRNIPKRASNSRRKETRTSCWVNGQRRKKDRIHKQDVAAGRNRQLRAEGKLTPWQEAKAARARRRAAHFAAVAAAAPGKVS